jgi:branched-chain amino acid transport system permease protein
MFAQLAVDGVQVGVLYALMASGFAVIFGTTRVLHYAHGSTYLIAGYTFFFLVSQCHAPVLVGAAAALVASIAFGVALDRFIYRRIKRDEGAFFTIFVASFGIGIIIENVVKMLFGNSYTVIETPLSRGVPIFQSVPAFPSIIVSPLMGLSLVTALLLLLALWWFFSRSDLGIALRGLSERPDLVNSFGLSSGVLSQFAFALGSALVVPAAIVASCSTGLVPSSGHHIILVSLVASIIGGVGSVVGAAIWKLSTNWSEAVAFLVLVVFILARPSGIFATHSRV